MENPTTGPFFGELFSETCFKSSSESTSQMVKSKKVPNTARSTKMADSLCKTEHFNRSVEKEGSLRSLYIYITCNLRFDHVFP